MEEQTLEKWKIRYQPDPPKMGKALQEYIETSIIPVLDFSPFLVCQSPASVEVGNSVENIIHWVVTQKLKQGKINSFVHVCSGLELLADGFYDADAAIKLLRSKSKSADLVWIQELSAAKLAPREMNRLFFVLKSLSFVPLIITSTTPIEALLDAVGSTISNHIQQTFQVGVN